eukprot:41938_1
MSEDNLRRFVSNFLHETQGASEDTSVDYLITKAKTAQNTNEILSELNLCGITQNDKSNKFVQSLFNKCSIQHNKQQKLNDLDLSIKQFQLKSLYYDIWKLSNGEQRYIHFDVMNQLHSKLNTTINYILIGVGDSSINSRSILETFIFHNNSNISNLYHGIMIEALPRNYNILKNVISKYPNMKDRTHLLNIGVSNKSGNDIFHGIDVDFMKDYYMKNKNKSMSEVPNWMKYQLGSFKTDGFHFQRWPTTNITINITTLSNIYNKQYKNIDIGMDRNGAIDILHIDTEGFDYIILKSFLESYIFTQLMDKKLNPTIINFERKLMNKDEENEIVNILDKYGYTQRRLNRGDDILAIFKPMKFKSHEWMKELSIPKPNKSNNVKQ